MSTLLTLLLSAALASDPTVEAPTPDDTAATDDVDAPETDEAEGEDEEVEEEEAEWEPRFRGELSPDFAHYDLEQLYAAGKFDEGLKATRARIAESPDDADLYWLAARFMYEQGELFQRDDPSIDKEAHYAEMVRLADVGLTKRPDDPHLLFARGIGNGRLGTTRGVLSSLWLASTVEGDWLAAVNSGYEYSSLDGKERMPCDVHHGLGIFYRLVPDAWIVKVLAGTRGSLDKSLMHLEKANSCSPGRQHIQKELGVTRLCIGTKKKDAAMLEKGKEILAKAAAHSGGDKKARIDAKHSQMLIDDPKLACGYSRDGQQDVDSSKLDQ